MKKLQLILSCFMLTFWLLSFNTNAASFDCKKAQTKVEKLICKDKELGILDEMLARQYRAQRKVFKNSSWVKSAQLEWLKSRNQTCTDVYACMDIYYARIAELKPYTTDNSTGTGRQFLGKKPSVFSHVTFFDFKDHILLMNWRKETTHSIEVIRKSDNQVIQIIDLGGDTDNLFYDTTKDYLDMPDINNDGYADITLLSSWGMHGNDSYAVWLYNPKTQNYEHSTGIGEYKVY